MAEKKLLTYEGLEEYNIKWHERLQEMILETEDIDDILDETFPNSWTFTVNTEATASGEKKTGVPLNLYEQTDVEFTVDWGDGTKSVLTPSLYLVANATASVHEYAEAGTYHVTITGNAWKRACLLKINNTSSIPTVTNDIVPLYWWRRTLISIDSTLPKVYGTNYNSSPNNVKTLVKVNNNFDYLFYRCTYLSAIPSGLLDNNASITSFVHCFSFCTSITAIPQGLFDKNTAATTFQGCFQNCPSIANIPSGLFDYNTLATSFKDCFQSSSSLASIPPGLFDHNPAVTSFYSCFDRCTLITSIPQGLFDHNPAVTNFGYCFWNCTALTSIPTGLFQKNTAVTFIAYCFQNCSSVTDFTLYIGSSSISNCSSFVTKKTGTTRTIYVPDNSTTKTKFDAVASSLELTIIPYTPA